MNDTTLPTLIVETLAPNVRKHLQRYELCDDIGRPVTVVLAISPEHVVQLMRERGHWTGHAVLYTEEDGSVRCGELRSWDNTRLDFQFLTPEEIERRKEAGS